MSKCTICREREAEMDTVWERICTFLCVHIFSDTVQEIRNEKFGEGYSYGYESGFKHASKNDQVAEMLSLVDKVKKATITNIHPDGEPNYGQD